MKYTTRITNLKTWDETEIKVNCRSDAKLETMAYKCIRACMDALKLNSVNVHYESPNIWMNACIGYIGLEDENGTYYRLSIFRDDNEILIFG